MYHVDICKCKNITFINPVPVTDTVDVFSAQAGRRIMACLYLQFDFIHVSLRNMSRFLLPSVFVGSKIFLTYLLNQWRSRSSFNRKKTRLL